MPVSVGTPLPVAAVLLKDVVLSNLPSPYYHFEYDTKGKVSFVSFASDFNRYNVIYRQSKISEMKNNILVNKDRLKYLYDSAGRVSTVKYTDSTGVVYARVNFTYNGQKLIKVKRERKSEAGFITVGVTHPLKTNINPTIIEVHIIRLQKLHCRFVRPQGLCHESLACSKPMEATIHYIFCWHQPGHQLQCRDSQSLSVLNDSRNWNVMNKK